MMIVALLSYVLSSFLLSKIFKKAGVDQWKAWVPVYNNWKTYELGGQSGFWAVLMFVPVINIIPVIFFYIAAYNIGLKLQKEGWFVLLMIFLPIVWLAWLAFDKSTWQNTDAAPVDIGTGEPPMPESMSPVGEPTQPFQAAEATPSETTVPSIESQPTQPEPGVTPTNSAQAEMPQPAVQSPEPAMPVEPALTVEATPNTSEAGQPAVDYPSVDGILSPTEPAAMADAPEQQPSQPSTPPTEPQPPVPPTQQ